MQAWKSIVAVAVAGVFAAGPVWAQSPTTPPADKPAGTMDKQPADTKMDKSMDKSTTGTDKAGMDKMHKAGKTAKGGNRDQVKAVQQALKDKGHDPGPVDGVMGAKTKAALKDFQKAQGMKESGSLDNETMTKLGVEMKTSAAGMSAPAASPATDNASKSSDASKEMPKSDNASASPKTDDASSAKPADNAAKPDASSTPSASPSTGTTDSTKPADNGTKPTEEKK